MSCTDKKLIDRLANKETGEVHNVFEVALEMFRGKFVRRNVRFVNMSIIDPNHFHKQIHIRLFPIILYRFDLSFYKDQFYT